MPESGINPQDHFVKQRRNLVIISLVLIFYHAADLSFDKVNILGNTVTIGHPEVVSFCLFSFFVYFLWRYFTIFNEVNGHEETIRIIKELIENYSDAYAQYYFSKKSGVNPKRIGLSRKKENNEFGEFIENYKYKVHTYPASLNEDQTAKLKGLCEVKGLPLFQIKFRAIAVSIFKYKAFW